MQSRIKNYLSKISIAVILLLTSHFTTLAKTSTSNDNLSDLKEKIIVLII